VSRARKTERNAAIVAMRDAGESYVAIARAFGICTRTARDVYERSCDDRATPRRRISMLSFDALIDTWNHLNARERAARAAECRTKGHDYRECPFSTPGDPVLVCRRCLNYVHPEERQAAA